VWGFKSGPASARAPARLLGGGGGRARRPPAAVDQKSPTTLQMKQVVTIEIEGEDKPGCVAESLSRLIYAD
jgi:hypothetical protein